MRGGPSTSLGATRLNCRNGSRHSPYLGPAKRPASRGHWGERATDEEAEVVFGSLSQWIKLPSIDHGGLVRLDVGLLNNRGERFALLAGEVCKGLAGKAGELDCKGIEAFA